MRIWTGILLPLMLMSGVVQADDEIVERALLIKDGRFQPEIVTVPAGKRIRLVVTNAGPGPEEFESTTLRKENVLAQGVTRNVIIAPLRPGEYSFFGEFHMDTAKGILKAE